MSLISSRSVDCRQTSTMCAPLRTWRRAISLASSHFSSAIRFLKSARADDVGALADDAAGGWSPRPRPGRCRSRSARCVGAGSARGVLPSTICAMARMWAGVVPQQPPTMLSQPWSTNFSSWRGERLGRLQVLAVLVGQPGVGIAGDARRRPSRGACGCGRS